MNLELLTQEFSVCKLNNSPASLPEGEYVFFARAGGEFSLVCEKQHVPEEVVEENPGWRAFRFCGVLDFSLTGVLSKLSTVLADARVSIFAVSTYDTDYVLVKENRLEKAVAALQKSGYTFSGKGKRP